MGWIWSWSSQLGAFWVGVIVGVVIAMAGFHFGDPLCKRCGRDKL